MQFTSTCNKSDAEGLKFGSLPPHLMCKRDNKQKYEISVRKLLLSIFKEDKRICLLSLSKKKLRESIEELKRRIGRGECYKGFIILLL